MKVKMSFYRRKRLTGYVFLSPWLLASVFLLFFPILFSLLLSFSTPVNLNKMQLDFVGLENYIKAFVSDVDFVFSFVTVVRETLTNLPMILVFSLLIAIMLSREIKGRGFFRSAFFLPVLLGTGFVMRQILGQGVDQSAMEVARGILLPPQVQAYMGPEVSGVIGEFLGRITVVMWKSGVQIVIFLAGIQKIPLSLYESARVDSATEWEMFWKITLPMLSPIILLNVVYTILASFSEDGPMMDYIRYIAFTQARPNPQYAAAMGWLYFAFVLLLVGLVFLIMKPFIKKSTD